jgi:hypothetical protein
MLDYIYKSNKGAANSCAFFFSTERHPSMKPRTTEAPRKPVHRNTKRTGELSEAAFLLKAETLGFHLAKPWGDRERYDFILDTGSRLWRVQLKCTQVLRARGYDVQAIYSIYGKGKVGYTPDDIDLLVAHIVPLKVWYILPIEAFTPAKAFACTPTSSLKIPAGKNTAKPGTFWNPTRNQQRVERTLLSAAVDPATIVQSQSGQPRRSQ